MARNLETLQKQYNTHTKPGGVPGRPMGRPMGGGPRGHMRGMGGKPKDMKKTVSRILSYIGNYK